MAAYRHINKELLEHLAKISRLELTEKELELFTDQLGVILEAFREIEKVETDNTIPSFHPSELKNIWRDDVSKPWNWDPIKNTEHKEGRYFKGPKIT